MERFRLSADFVFEAENITDAFLQLTDHFAKRALNQKSSIKITQGGLQITKIVPNIIGKTIINDLSNKEEGY